MARQAFLVLGMHRSGTSATTRLLNLAGVSITAGLMRPQPDNPKGFWESQAIADLHDRAFAQLGMAWDSIETIPDEWFASSEADVLRTDLRAELGTDFPDGESFVVKDPRLCRFLPAWLQVLEELGYQTVPVMPVRNPLEVARSLDRRNAFAVAKSLLLWLRHVLDAEAGTRGRRRAIVRYDRLIEDWRQELADANRQLGFTCFPSSRPFDEQVDRFLSAAERHHVATLADLREADSRGWATDAFIALQQLHDSASAAATADAYGTLDRLRGRLDDAESAIDPFLATYRTQLQEARSVLAGSQSEAAQLREVLDRHVTELANVVAARGVAEQKMSEAMARTAALQISLDEATASLSEERRSLDEVRLALTRAGEAAARDRSERRRLLEAERLAWQQAAAASADAERIDIDRDALRRASDEAIRAVLRNAARRQASLRRARDQHPGWIRRLHRLLSDAGAPPSRWIGEPLRSGRNLIRLRRHEYRRRITLLASSGLFDPAYYGRSLGPVAANLPARFLLRGDLAGERTHPLFDPEWYRQSNPDLPPGVPPLEHYLTQGGWQLRSPHPLFDAGFYLSQWAPGEVSGTTPLSHFLEVGAAAGVSPHPLFDALHYLQQRPDVAAAGANPLLHYLASPPGSAADPHRLFCDRDYLARNPDVEGLSALEHFVRHGAIEGRSPHPLFDVGYYWRQRPDVRAAGVNPLRHFLESGSTEGIDPHPLFSCRYYQSQFHGRWDRRVNALEHYLRWGGQDLRNPHPEFDSRLYLAAYPDVAAAGLNPLLHYLLHGAEEGRQRFPAVRLSSNRDRATGTADAAAEDGAASVGEPLGAFAAGLAVQSARVTEIVLQIDQKLTQLLQAQAAGNGGRADGPLHAAGIRRR